MPDAADTARERLKGRRAFIVPYCHPDWAWTHTRHWHEMRYVLAIDEVLDILNEQDRAGVPPDAPHAFRWYMDVFCTQFDLFRRARPKQLKELRRRIAEGRVAVCGAYSNVRINHVEGETFVRSLIYGRRAFAEHLPEADLSVHADSVDTAVGHPQVPQLLTQAGYPYFQFWRPNDALHVKGVPYYFVWEGLDGTRVLCNRGCYGGIISPVYVEGRSENWDGILEAWWRHTLEDRADHSPADIMVAYHGCDDARPLRLPPHSDAPLDLPGVIEEWNRREDSSLRFATPVDVFRELEKLRHELPVVRGTLDPCDVGYNAAWSGSRGLWKLRSECARTIGAAETLSALAQAAGVEKPRASALQVGYESLWRDTLLVSAHAIQWLFQNDFDELYELAQLTLADARRRQHQTLEALTDRVALPRNAVSIHFNTLPHEREAVVPLRVTFVEGDKGGVPEALRLADAEGEELPYQILDRMNRGDMTWEMDTLVQLRLPACGWNVVCWQEQQPSFAPDGPDEPNAIENEAIRLEFHLGRLMRIVDKDTGITWQAPEHTPFGHLRAYQVDTTAPLHVGPIIGQLDARWESWRVTERGPVRWTVCSEGLVGPHKAALETRLYRGERRVEFRAEIEWAGMDGFIASHAPYPGPGNLVGDMPFCVEEKDLSEEPYVGIERQRQGLFIAQSFVDWSDDGQALAYVSHDGDRYYVLDEERHALAHILVNSVRRPADTWEQHVNQQMEGEGRHEFTYSLIPHTGPWRDAELWRVAAELRTQPLTAWPRASGRLAPRHSLMSVSPANVSLSACYVEGDKTLIRVFENAGIATLAKITLPAKLTGAQVVNLLGEPMPGAKMKRRGSTLSINLQPWQIVTLAVSTA